MIYMQFDIFSVLVVANKKHGSKIRLTKPSS